MTDKTSPGAAPERCGKCISLSRLPEAHRFAGHKFAPAATPAETLVGMTAGMSEGAVRLVAEKLSAEVASLTKRLDEWELLPDEPGGMRPVGMSNVQWQRTAQNAMKAYRENNVTLSEQAATIKSMTAALAHVASISTGKVREVARNALAEALAGAVGA